MKSLIHKKGDSIYIEEEWKPVQNYEGYYEVSNFGKVKSVERTIWNTRGNGFYQTVKSKILKPMSVGAFCEYDYVYLYKEGRRKKHTLHRLVYQTFVGEIPAGMEVDHIDDDYKNSSLDNLQIMSKPDNLRKSFKGKRSYTKVSYKLIDTFTGKETIFRTSGEMSKSLNVCTTHIRNCAMGRSKYKLIKGRYKVEPIDYISK